MTGSVILNTAGAALISAGVGAAATLSFSTFGFTADEAKKRGYNVGRIAATIASFALPLLFVGKFLFSQAANVYPVASVFGLMAGGAVGMIPVTVYEMIQGLARGGH